MQAAVEKDQVVHIGSVDELEPIQYQWKFRDTAFGVSLLMSGQWVAEWKPLIGGTWVPIGGARESAADGFDAVVEHINRCMDEGAI